MRLFEHTLSSDASIHLGGLVVKMILASDLITHAVPLGAARANTKHLHLFSKCSEIEAYLSDDHLPATHDVDALGQAVAIVHLAALQVKHEGCGLY